MPPAFQVTRTVHTPHSTEFGAPLSFMRYLGSGLRREETLAYQAGSDLTVDHHVRASDDNGQTWTDEINFGPFLTTGYADIVATGPGRFLCAFDCTPPQPWTQHAAHWIGVVDVTVEQEKE